MLHRALADERRVEGDEALERLGKRARVRMKLGSPPSACQRSSMRRSSGSRLSGDSRGSASRGASPRHGALTVAPPPEEVTVKFVSSCLAYA